MDERRPEVVDTPNSAEPANRAGADSNPTTNIRDPAKPQNAQSATGDLVTHATSAAREVVEHAKSAAEEVVDHAKNTAGEAFASMAEDVARQAPEIAQRVRDQAGTVADDLYRSGGEYLSRQVETYPLTSLLVAAAVGYGLGYLVSRSD